MFAYIILFLKGLAMGAADVVPGVSGGTIAFISGIYERLINALKSIRPSVLGVLFKEGIGAAWRAIDGTFLLVLMLGIMTSVLTLSKVIGALLLLYPQLLWSFFAGLVLASTWVVGQELRTGLRRVEVWICFLVGTAIAFAITQFSPSHIEPTYLMVFVAGAIAICAMILPGISGSFILLLMGMYAHVLDAARSLDVVFLGIFMAGCLIGLLSFSHVLSWLFRNYRAAALALLVGFMLGSMPKVWPWQNVLEMRLSSKGEVVPFLYENVLPSAYMNPYTKSTDAMLVGCIGLFIVGFTAVFLLERLGSEKKEG